MENNPFTITFGKEPHTLITRYEDTDRILSTFDAENPVSQTFLIEGLRGSGKTVLMTTVAKALAETKNWVVVNLNPTMDLLSNFAIRLNEVCNSTPDILSKSFKLLVKKKKRVLITIDEVVHDDNMRIFASQFQIFLRQDFPIFLIMTGLYENIYEIQNDPSLTFLLRAPKITTAPLSILQITRQYRDIFKIDEGDANNLAAITKGYAFAFQALGVSFWVNRDKDITYVLEKFDELLDDFVYKKIWSSLTSKERAIMRSITDEEVSAGEICKSISMNNSTFSRYRDSLIKKGILQSVRFGYVTCALPRFNEIIRNY